jgi:hypothetical protein
VTYAAMHEYLKALLEVPEGVVHEMLELLETWQPLDAIDFTAKSGAYTLRCPGGQFELRKDGERVI